MSCSSEGLQLLCLIDKGQEASGYGAHNTQKYMVFNSIMNSYLLEVGNEIGGHPQLLCKDLIVVARHALWKSILDERDVSVERCFPDGVTT